MTAHASLKHPAKYQLSVADYTLLDASGAFGDQRTELVEGDVIVMSPQFRPHGMVKLDLYDRLRETLREIGSPFRPVTEFSLEISRHSLPEPDILLTDEPYGEGAVPLSSAALVIEVADATLDIDLGVKVALYAGAGIREYWVADVNARVIHQMWAPEGEGYSQRPEPKPFGEPIAAATIEGLVVETGGLN